MPSQCTHGLLYLLALRCPCVNEWHALCEAGDEPCSALLWCLIMTEGSSQRGALSGVSANLPRPRDTQGPCEGSGQRWAKRVHRTLLSRSAFPGLFDHFVIAWGIRTINLICRTTDSLGTCDPRCYCARLLGLHVRKRPALLGAASCRCMYGARRSSGSWNLSQPRCHPPDCLPRGPEA